MQHLLGRAKWDADQVRDDVCATEVADHYSCNPLDEPAHHVTRAPASQATTQLTTPPDPTVAAFGSRPRSGPCAGQSPTAPPTVQRLRRSRGPAACTTNRRRIFSSPASRLPVTTTRHIAPARKAIRASWLHAFLTSDNKPNSAKGCRFDPNSTRWLSPPKRSALDLWRYRFLPLHWGYTGEMEVAVVNRSRHPKPTASVRTRSPTTAARGDDAPPTRTGAPASDRDLAYLVTGSPLPGSQTPCQVASSPGTARRSSE